MVEMKVTLRNQDRADLGRCTSCGAPTPGDGCAFCRLVVRATRA
jgi:hypothetical protein